MIGIILMTQLILCILWKICILANNSQLSALTRWSIFESCNQSDAEFPLGILTSKSG